MSSGPRSLQELVKRAEETSQDSTRDLVAEAISGGWAANVYVDRNMVETACPKDRRSVPAAQATKVADGRFEAVSPESVEGTSVGTRPRPPVDPNRRLLSVGGGIQIYKRTVVAHTLTTGFTFIRSKNAIHRLLHTVRGLRGSTTVTTSDQLLGLSKRIRWARRWFRSLIPMRGSYEPCVSSSVLRYQVTSKISNPDNSPQGITVCQVGVGKANQGFNPISCGAVTSIDGQSGVGRTPTGIRWSRHLPRLQRRLGRGRCSTTPPAGPTDSCVARSARRRSQCTRSVAGWV